AERGDLVGDRLLGIGHDLKNRPADRFERAALGLLNPQQIRIHLLDGHRCSVGLTILAGPARARCRPAARTFTLIVTAVNSLTLGGGVLDACSDTGRDSWGFEGEPTVAVAAVGGTAVTPASDQDRARRAPDRARSP